MRPASEAASILVPTSTRQLINSSTTILAFGFLSPWLLWGLALGGVPILIQWLHRRNYTQRVWAAMRFLQAAAKTQSRRLRFESLLLLLIRTLILMLAALALAEPVLESAGWLPETETSVHRLIVIDTSLSMQYEADGRSVRERARDAARTLVAESRPGDSFQVVTINREGRVLIRQPAFDPAEVLAEIEQLGATEERGAPLAALELAERLLKDAPKNGLRQVAIISDFQRSNWWPAVESERTRMQQALAGLSQSAELSIVPVGDDEPVNTAITDLQVDPSLATAGMPVYLRAGVRCTPGMPRSVPVELVETDRVLQTTTVEIPASGEATATFTTAAGDAGTRRLEVRLPPDGLSADNHRWVTIDVRDELSVLLVNGRESGEPLDEASAFVEVALAPALPPESRERRGTPGLMGYRPVVVNEAEFARTELAGFDCIVLCDVPLLGENMSARLDRFVRSGGGLIIGLGPQIRPDAYNQWQSAAGSRFLPGQLVQVRGDEDGTSEPFHFAEPVARHPIIEPFFGNPQAGLTTAIILQYYHVEVSEPEAGSQGSGVRSQESGARGQGAEVEGAGAVRVALSYSNSDPAIVEREYGAGRILLVTTSLDDRWGNWALWPSFLPMVHGMVRHAVSGPAGAAYIVGDRLRREYPVQTVGMPVTVQQPDGRRSPGQSMMDSGATTVTFDATSQSGIYRFVLGPPVNETELIAVNVDARESDLRTLGDGELSSTLLAGIDADLRTSESPRSAASGAGKPSRLLTSWLLVVLLVLLLVEQIMAWNARYGLMALAASPLIVAGFAVLPTVTVISLVAGLGAILWRRYGVLAMFR